MTDLLERTPVRDELLDEQRPATKVERPLREERDIERPTARQPVRWIRWMLAALVLIVGATVLAFALRSEETVVLDTDGSFQAVETMRMEALAPAAIIDVDGSFQVAENLRFERLAPAELPDGDGSFQVVETRRMENLKPAT